jgi:hypothetical protein
MPPSAATTGSVAAARQLARYQLLFDLEADDEEEQCHQAVVDPMTQVFAVHVAADREDDVGVPERLVTRAPRRVGPHQRHDRRRQQYEAAGRLDRQEPRERTCDRARQ